MSVTFIVIVSTAALTTAPTSFYQEHVTGTGHDSTAAYAQYIEHEFRRSYERDAVSDFIEAAKAITPTARAVPPTHLQADGDLRFTIDVEEERAKDVAMPGRRIARARRREVVPIRSRPGFRARREAA